MSISESKKRLAGQVSLTTIANLSHAAAQWLLLVIVVKQFDEDILGQFVLTLSVISPIFLLLSFKLRTLVVTDFHNQLSFEQYFHARLFAQVITVLVILLLAPLALNTVTPVLVISVVVFKLADGISELSYSYLHKQQAFVLAAKSQTIRSLSSICILLLFTTLSNDVELTFIAWASSHVAFAVIDSLIVAKKLQQSENRSYQLLTILTNLTSFKATIRLYRQYWPIGFSLVFGALFVYIPNYVLQHFNGTKSVGEFAAVSYFLVAGGIIIHSLSQAATPKLSQLFNTHQHSAFITLTLKLMVIGAGVGIISLLVVTFFGQWLLTTMYSEAIGKLHTELQLVILASLFRYSYLFLGSALNVLKGFNEQAWVYGLGSLSLLLFCLYFVPQYGTLGAGISLVCACLVEFFIMVIIFIKKWQKVRSLSMANNELIS